MSLEFAMVMMTNPTIKLLCLYLLFLIQTPPFINTCSQEAIVSWSNSLSSFVSATAKLYYYVCFLVGFLVWIFCSTCFGQSVPWLKLAFFGFASACQFFTSALQIFELKKINCTMTLTIYWFTQMYLRLVHMCNELCWLNWQCVVS